MGQIIKTGNVYYIEFFARGLMYSQVAGSNEDEARRLLEAVEHKISQGEALTIVREIDLDVFFQKFLEQAQEQFSSKSLKRFSQAWKHLDSFIRISYPSVNKLSQLTPSILEAYRSSLMKTIKPKIVNLTILLLREILEYGIKIGFINDNPTLHICLLETPCKSYRYGKRLEAAQDLLGRGIGLAKTYQLLKLKDVAQIMFWSNFIPLKREDVYN